MFDRILQDRQSIAINRTDTSTTKSKQLYPAIPVSKISSWAGGEFVGMVVDDPDQKIDLKAFCPEIINDVIKFTGRSKRQNGEGKYFIYKIMNL